MLSMAVLYRIPSEKSRADGNHQFPISFKEGKLNEGLVVRNFRTTAYDDKEYVNLGDAHSSDNTVWI
jgi:hypothetical protein